MKRFSFSGLYCSTFILFLWFGSATHAYAQNCLPDGINFSSQAQIDNFSSDYPDCTIIDGDVIIEEAIDSDITDLSGLSDVIIINGDFDIRSNLALASILDLQNLSFVSGTISIEDNPSLTACAINVVCQRFNNDPPQITILNNGTGCNDVFEVIEECEEIDVCEPEASVALFDFDECSSFIIAGSNEDYSELGPEITQMESCSEMKITGIYRENPELYPHSCTPGMGETKAVCISAANTCTYNINSPASIIIDVEVSTGEDGLGRLSNLSFFEQAPENFTWIDGDSGENNPPEFFGVSVQLGEDIIFSSPEIQTNSNWTLHNFDFSNIPAFTVTETTVFTIKLVAYCPIGTASPVMAWDLENLILEADCPPPVDGGIITLDDGSASTTICVGDGNDDTFNVNLDEAEGSNSVYIITDSDQTILALQVTPSFNLESAGGGTCFIYHVSYESIQGLSPGESLGNLIGCFGLSNSIEVIREPVNGGMLTGGPFSFCVDGSPNFVSGIVLTDNEGQTSQWLVTDQDGTTILGLPQNIEDVNFDDAGLGTCLIWNLSYNDITGLEVGNSTVDLDGCFHLSNSIEVVRSQVSGGAITGGPFEFCVGDGIADFALGLDLTGNDGDSSQWVITDDMGTILGLPDNPEAVDFDQAGNGECLIWHLAYNTGLTGLEVNSLVEDIQGCFNFSNSISVSRSEVNGGMITGGPYNFCIDGEADFALGLDLTGNVGMNSGWIITNQDSTTILGLPDNPEAVNFDDAGEGICLIWHISYQDGITGLEEDASLADLDGCFSLSNAITVSRNGLEGGMITGGPFSFCVGNGEADFVSGIVLSGNTGSESQWLVTDGTGDIILGLPGDITEVDFDGAGIGTCLIWHLSHDGNIEGLMVDSLVSNLNGCFDLSNSIAVERTEANGGTITGGPFEFCIGDGIDDFVSGIVLSGNAGQFSQWVITDDQDNILGLPTSPEEVNFEDAGGGLCRIWHMSFNDGLTGLEVGNNFSVLTGCFDLSNSIDVVRNAQNGGNITGGPYGFCIDGSPDIITDIVLTDNIGGNSQWVITNENGTVILGLPNDPSDVDFDGVGPGVCLIWHLSYADGLMGLEVDSLLTNLDGCFSFSNSISVSRGEAEGGEISGGPFNFCVGDGMEDNATGITLTGNSGVNSQWLVTDATGDTILGLPTSPGAVDFDGAGPGTCLIWHLSYADGLIGLEIDSLVSNFIGCFDLSNSIDVIRDQPDGGSIFGGPFEFCVGDGLPDNTSGIMISGQSGANSQWVITDEDGETILGLPSNPDLVDFDGAGVGVCRIWHLSYADGLTGLMVNGTVSDLEGCFDFSNAIVVNRVSGTDCMGAGETIVINEIGPGSMIELKNVSDVSIDVSSYFICDFPAYEMVGSTTLICGDDFVLAPDEIIAFSTSQISISALDGELGLYTVADYSNPDAIIDYLEWGSTPHERSSTAVAAGIWTTGDFVPAWNTGGLNLNWDGMGDASSNWFEQASSYCEENTPTSNQAIAINEFNAGTIVELKNISSNPVDISSYFLCGDAAYDQISSLTVVCGGDFMLDPNEIITVNASTVMSDADDGELALYVAIPFNDPANIRDYVEWGTTGHSRSFVAQSAGIWANGDFVPAWNSATNLNWDGTSDAATSWFEQADSYCDENQFVDEDDELFRINPNPVVNEVYFQMMHDMPDGGTIQIMDVLGNTTHVLNIEDFNQLDKISLDDLQTGYYFIQLSDSRRSQTKRFLKY